MTQGGFQMRSKSATHRSAQDPFGVVFLPTGRQLLGELLRSLVPRSAKGLLVAIAVVAAAAGVVAGVGLADATRAAVDPGPRLLDQ